MRRLRTLGRKGTAAIEFAAVAPVILLVVWAMWDVYNLLGTQRTLDFAVTQALRQAAVSSTTDSASNIEAAVSATMQTLVGVQPVQVSVTFSPAYQPGGTVSITAQYAWTPLLLPAALAAVTLTSTGALTVQN